MEQTKQYKKNSEIKIIHHPREKEPFLIIYKNAGLATAPLSKDDKNNALAISAELYPEINQIQGKKTIEYGLIHRIDTPTKGLVLIATSQDFYDYIQNEQKENRFIKTYKATCEENLNNTELLQGFPKTDLTFHQKLLKNETITIQSYFRSYGENNYCVRPVTESCSKIIKNKVGKFKLYSTTIKLNRIIKENEKIKYEFLCSLTSGFRHQVRAHLCWLGFPIIGDKIYNCTCNNSNSVEPTEMQFEATSLSFYWNEREYNFTV